MPVSSEETRSLTESMAARSSVRIAGALVAAAGQAEEAKTPVSRTKLNRQLHRRSPGRYGRTVRSGPDFHTPLSAIGVRRRTWFVSRRQSVISTTASPARSATVHCRRSRDTSPEAPRTSAAATCSRSMVRTPTPVVVAIERRSASAYTERQSTPLRINRPTARSPVSMDIDADSCSSSISSRNRLEAQCVSHLQFVQAVNDDGFTPPGDKSSDVVAPLLAHIELDQYAGVEISAHRSPRPSAMACAAVMPLTGLGYTSSQALLRVAPVGRCVSGRHRNDTCDGSPATAHFRLPPRPPRRRERQRDCAGRGGR